MSDGRYAVLRCVADPGRQEALNLGLVAWAEGQICLEIGSRAAQRIARQSLDLAASDLIEIGDELALELKSIGAGQGATLDEAVRSWMESTPRFPFSFSEVRQTTVAHGTSGLQTTVDRLLERIVQPRHHKKALADQPTIDPVKQLATSLQALVKTDKVVKAHRFPRSRSGVERRVAYFANSASGTALDIVRLTRSSETEIRARGDAAAFKIEDILEANSTKMMVFCALHHGRELARATNDALTSLKSVGAAVHTDPHAASSAFRRAALGPSLLE